MSAENAKRDWSKVRRRASRLVNIRLTPEEENDLRSRANDEQTTVAHLLKTRALGQPIRRRVRPTATADVDLLRSIHANLGRLSGNSYQIVRAMNFGRQVPDTEAVSMLKEIRSELLQLRAQLFAALNKEP